jgi:hypothetical protein
MDASERRPLEDRIIEEVKMMLTEGDIHYLMGKDRAGLMEALEHECRFLGLYHRDDWESLSLIHKLLEENIDQWYESYLKPRLEEKAQRASSPWIQETSSAGTGIALSQATKYIGFMLPTERPLIQISQDTVQG